MAEEPWTPPSCKKRARWVWSKECRLLWASVEESSQGCQPLLMDQKEMIATQVDSFWDRRLHKYQMSHRAGVASPTKEDSLARNAMTNLPSRRVAKTRTTGGHYYVLAFKSIALVRLFRSNSNVQGSTGVRYTSSNNASFDRPAAPVGCIAWAPSSPPHQDQ